MKLFRTLTRRSGLHDLGVCYGRVAAPGPEIGDGGQAQSSPRLLC